MSYGSPDFGTVNIERPKAKSSEPFWTTAERERFTEVCEQQRLDHMVGSYGDRTVSGAVVVGYLEGPAKKKGAR